jgi:hydrogenase expression/formation protein HypC
MCLGLPGSVVSKETNALGLTFGVVDFGGVERVVRLDYVPDVEVGDSVLVHMGFALEIIDGAEVPAMLENLGKIRDLSGLRVPGTS